MSIKQIVQTTPKENPWPVVELNNDILSDFHCDGLNFFASSHDRLSAILVSTAGGFHWISPVSGNLPGWAIECYHSEEHAIEYALHNDLRVFTYTSSKELMQLLKKYDNE